MGDVATYYFKELLDSGNTSGEEMERILNSIPVKIFGGDNEISTRPFEKEEIEVALKICILRRLQVHIVTKRYSFRNIGILWGLTR